MKYQKPTVGLWLTKQMLAFCVTSAYPASPLKQNNGARLNTPLFFRYCSNRFL